MDERHGGRYEQNEGRWESVKLGKIEEIHNGQERREILWIALREENEDKGLVCSRTPGRNRMASERRFVQIESCPGCTVRESSSGYHP